MKWQLSAEKRKGREILRGLARSALPGMFLFIEKSPVSYRFVKAI
jgi:hypothetical protein